MTYHQSRHGYLFLCNDTLSDLVRKFSTHPMCISLQIAFFKHTSVVRIDCQNIMCICINRQRQILIRGKILLKTIYPQNMYAKAGNKQ